MVPIPPALHDAQSVLREGYRIRSTTGAAMIYDIKKKPEDQGGIESDRDIGLAIIERLDLIIELLIPKLELPVLVPTPLPRMY